jgi:hypothetical protein
VADVCLVTAAILPVLLAQNSSAFLDEALVDAVITRLAAPAP